MQWKEGFRLDAPVCGLDRSHAPALAFIHKSLREQPNPGGVQANSRGLSEATPPEGKTNKISTPEGSQFFLRGLRKDTTRPNPPFAAFLEEHIGFWADCCDPSGVVGLFQHYPEVSLRSTFRLLADNPPGC